MLGGSGFIGSHITEKLIERGADVTITMRKKDEKHMENIKNFHRKINIIIADLRDAKNCKEAINGQQVVINAACLDGGSKFKGEHPFEIFYNNALIALNVVSILRETKPEHVVQFSSAAIYLQEKVSHTASKEAMDNVFPPTELPYAYSWSKILSELTAKFFSCQYDGAKFLIVRPNNIFGPRDITDKARLRLIPYLIGEIEKSPKEIKLSGPGNQILSFLYVEDFASNLLKMIELQKKSFDVVNVGSEEEISMKELCCLIARLMNTEVNFVFDADVCPPIRKLIDVENAKGNYGFKQTVSLEKGLKKLLAFKNETFGSL